MPVVITEVVTEVVLAPTPDPGSPGAGAPVDEELLELVVRRAAERVLEVLRREWDR